MRLALLIAATLAAAAATPASGGETMEVRGRHLYSAAGERVVLRGVNEMFPFSSDPTGERTMAEIARTGANSVRIFTLPSYTAASLDAAIGNAIANGLIPIPECHAATGKWELLGECVAYWTRPDIAAAIARHRRWVVLNIANEAGQAVAREDFAAGYSSAIAAIRAAGIDVPLMIDGADWGKEYRILIDSCASPYEWAMEELERAEIGWLAWSWGLVPNGDCRAENRYDMTDGGTFGRWKSPAGERIALTHPASIRNTSRRPCSIPNAGENCVAPGRD